MEEEIGCEALGEAGDVDHPQEKLSGEDPEQLIGTKYQGQRDKDMKQQCTTPKSSLFNFVHEESSVQASVVNSFIQLPAQHTRIELLLCSRNV